MIKTTLGALAGAEPALAEVCQLKLRAQIAYRLKKIARVVMTETQHYHTERNKLIREFGTKDETGNYVLKPDNPNLEVFSGKVKELSEVEVGLECEQVDLEMLGDEKVTAAALNALGPLLLDPK